MAAQTAAVLHSEAKVRVKPLGVKPFLFLAAKRQHPSIFGHLTFRPLTGKSGRPY